MLTDLQGIHYADGMQHKETAMAEMRNPFRSSDAIFVDPTHNSHAADKSISRFPMPVQYENNGASSHFSGDAATAGIGSTHESQDPLRNTLHKDGHIPRASFEAGLFGAMPQFGNATAMPQYYFSGFHDPAHAQERLPFQPISLQNMSTQQSGLRKLDSRMPSDLEGPSESPRSGESTRQDTLDNNRRQGGLVRKRKRSDGGPEAVLEGIFIVTRQPKNGQIKSIAAFIGWTFHAVKEWFEKRALWDSSCSSVMVSQDADKLPSNSTPNLTSFWSGDSGFFDFPGKLPVAVPPRNRPKRQAPGDNKNSAVSGSKDSKEEKPYLCIVENCTYSAAKSGDWKRHIASVHYPGRWACTLPEKGEILPTDMACPSCGMAFQALRELKRHIHLSVDCPDLSGLVRLFDRKDKLQAHWAKDHRDGPASRLLGDDDICEREVRDFVKKCGFCDDSFLNWDKKMEHVALLHFKDEGRNLSTWRFLDHDGDKPSTSKSHPNNGNPNPKDSQYRPDTDTSDSEDSDSDDRGDRLKYRRHYRRDDRDRDRGGNSGSGGNYRQPPDDSRSGSGGGSSKGSKGRTNYGKSHYPGHGGSSAQGKEAASDHNLLPPMQLTWSLRHCDLSLPEGLPAHKIIRRLGSGGFGAVHAIRIESTNQLVACKRIARFPDQRRDFPIELEMLQHLKSLNHPHVVKFLGSYTSYTHIDIIISPVADCDLNDFMLQQQPPVLPAIKSQMLGFFSCLGAAVEYIHSRKIRHRDIKPKNILIADGRVLIADFGSAISWDICRKTGTESVGITPKYTAPEVLNGGHHGRAADIWALGCVFLELMTIICDKTRSDFELFPSSNATVKIDRPFHATPGKDIVWLSLLSKLDVTSPLTWQGVNYLDTIAEMLQEDKEKRPKAAELRQRFPPSNCCSTEGSKNLLYLAQPHLTVPVKMNSNLEATHMLKLSLQEFLSRAESWIAILLIDEAENVLKRRVLNAVTQTGSPAVISSPAILDDYCVHLIRNSGDLTSSRKAESRDTSERCRLLDYSEDVRPSFQSFDVKHYWERHSPEFPFEIFHFPLSRRGRYPWTPLISRDAVGDVTPRARRFDILYHLRKSRPQPNSEKRPPSLHTLLFEHWDALATDPRDKVFALMGLVVDGDDCNIDVNYGLSINQVYTNIAREYVRLYGNLNIILPKRRQNPGHNLPSWCPDWSSAMPNLDGGNAMQDAEPFRTAIRSMWSHWSNFKPSTRVSFFSNFVDSAEHN
jgi:serine/threonine protein kinase